MVCFYYWNVIQDHEKNEYIFLRVWLVTPPPPPPPLWLLSLCPFTTITATGRPWQPKTLILSLRSSSPSSAVLKSLPIPQRETAGAQRSMAMTSVSVGRQLMVNNVTGVRRVPGWRMPRRTNETHHLHNSVLDKAEEGEEWLCNYCTEYLRNPSTYNPCVCVCVYSDNMTHRGQWLHIGTSNHLFI